MSSLCQCLTLSLHLYENKTRYPCVEKGSMFQCYRGHSAHVTRVRFSHDHRFLLSIGGGDKALIQWRHDVEDLDSSDDDEPAAVPKRAGAQRKDGGVEAWELVQVHPDALRRTPLQVRGMWYRGGGGGRKRGPEIEYGR